MQKISIFCDICKREFTGDKEGGQISGAVIKVNDKLEQNLLGFSGHYCGECLPKILEHIEKLGDETNKINEPQPREPAVRNKRSNKG